MGDGLYIALMKAKYEEKKKKDCFALGFELIIYRNSVLLLLLVKLLLLPR
jgi:hypothetical protein